MRRFGERDGPSLLFSGIAMATDEAAEFVHNGPHSTSFMFQHIQSDLKEQGKPLTQTLSMGSLSERTSPTPEEEERKKKKENCFCFLNGMKKRGLCESYTIDTFL